MTGGPIIPLSPPYRPAVCESACDYFESLLQPDFRVFEWGTGGSTLWLAQRVHHVVTVENVIEWMEEVRGYAKTEGLTNIQRILCQWRKGQPYRDEMLQLYADSILQFPDDHFDLVYSDGWGEARHLCLPQGGAKVKPGGWLVADDYSWNPVRSKAKMLEQEGWRLVTVKGGLIYSGWQDDGKPRKTTTGFLQKPEG